MYLKHIQIFDRYKKNIMSPYIFPIYFILQDYYIDTLKIIKNKISTFHIT